MKYFVCLLLLFIIQVETETNLPTDFLFEKSCKKAIVGSNCSCIARTKPRCCCIKAYNVTEESATVL